MYHIDIANSGLETDAAYLCVTATGPIFPSLPSFFVPSHVLETYRKTFDCVTSFTNSVAIDAMLRVGVRPFLLGRRILTQTSQFLIQSPVLQHEQHHQHLHSISGSLPPSRISNRTSQCRYYISEMRKSAFEANILRLIRNEIQYELDHSPPQQSDSEFNEFTVDERQGEQWVRLQKKFGNNEEIKVEVTMFDGEIPIPKPDADKNAQLGEEVLLHISLIVSIFKQNKGQVLEFVCSAWPDSVEIDKVYVRDRAQMPLRPYFGPPFKQLDDALQDSLYEFLEARGIDDTLCVFLHKFMKNKDSTEYLRWMGKLKSYIEQKAT